LEHFKLFLATQVWLKSLPGLLHLLR